MPAVQGTDCPASERVDGMIRPGNSGGFGAGNLLGLDMSAMRTAIGIALSQAAGFRAMHGHTAQPAPGGANRPAGGVAGASPVHPPRWLWMPECYSEQPEADARASGRPG